MPCFPTPSLQFLTLAHAPFLRTHWPVTSVFIRPFNEDEWLLRTTKPRRVPISTRMITSRLHVNTSLHEHASQHLIIHMVHSSPRTTSLNLRVSPQSSRATSTSRVYDVILPHRQPPQQRWLCVCPIATSQPFFPSRSLSPLLSPAACNLCPSHPRCVKRVVTSQLGLAKLRTEALNTSIVRARPQSHPRRL